jgi:WD40-like Beta Propeller Repeat
MRSNLSIKVVGLSASAVLAVIYVLVMLASLLLVGLGTTGSWQAVFLGIGWSTVAGFEIGLLGVVILGFAIAVVFVPAYNSVRRLVVSRSKTPAQPSQGAGPTVRSWAVRLLTALFVVLPVTLLVLRVLAPALASGVTPDAAGGNAQGPGGRTQAVNMGHTINTAMREAEPSFTADGRTMYFNCNNTDICVSHRTGTWEPGSWTPPELVGPPISTEYEEVEPVIDGAGDQLYFTSIRSQGFLKLVPFLSPFINVFEVVNTLATAKLGRSFFGGLGLEDVWVNYRINGVWSEPRNLSDVPDEPHINTPFDDHCLFFSADGNEAFRTSTRPGGFGDNDIWTSRRVNGAWTEPENLGPNVNGAGSEHTSIPTPDGRSRYVTSDRPSGYGGDDIYVTTRGTDGKWSPLVNLGPLVNGPGDDRCPAWTPDLKIFIFDSVRQGGFGGRDIWWVHFKDVTGYPHAAGTTGAIMLGSRAQGRRHYPIPNPFRG